MSIVVQGGLANSQLTEVARNCQHWRALFPDAEIIIAVSTSDVLRDPMPGRIPALVPARRFADDMRVTAALALIERCCDAIVIAEPALPMPPIKTNTAEPNNVNLQTAAARAGLTLARATTCCASGTT